MVAVIEGRMTMNLIEFLLPRITEDAAVARDAAPGPWRTDGPAREARVYSVPTGISVAVGWQRDLSHVVRHDPARVLAECEAKRAIMANCDPDFGYGRSILLILAAVYADHPDFDPMWQIRP